MIPSIPNKLSEYVGLLIPLDTEVPTYNEIPSISKNNLNCYLLRILNNTQIYTNASQQDHAVGCAFYIPTAKNAEKV